MVIFTQKSLLYKYAYKSPSFRHIYEMKGKFLYFEFVKTKVKKENTVLRHSDVPRNTSCEALDSIYYMTTIGRIFKNSFLNSVL